MEGVTATPLTSTLGARVDGVDLKQPIGDELAETIRQLLAEHAVLVFRNQGLDDEQQRAVAAIFGPLTAAPSRKLFGFTDPVRRLARTVFHMQDEGTIPYPPQRDDFGGWHVDDTFCEEIPTAATLRSEVLAKDGGDTSWSSMAAVFESFSPSMQGWLQTLSAIHAAPPHFRATVGFYELPKEEQRRFNEELAFRSHPVVVRHPVSGRKCLFVNPAYTQEIEGLSRRESAMLLRFLFTESARSEFVYRHHWEEGDLCIWDEIATWHAGPVVFAPERELVRIYGGLTKPQAAREFA
jgi:taurine dioxygenase